MSEKSKIDVMTSDREKVSSCRTCSVADGDKEDRHFPFLDYNADLLQLDFISSVSHELRSPLHGVLASTEALQELSTGLLQDELIRTITVCGEILLDTMDHM